MNKLEYVTKEVFRIVDGNIPTDIVGFASFSLLSVIKFNINTGRHEIECFFGIDFEQEQVDAWATVQNIIDDVMNLWVAPINRIERIDVEYFQNRNYVGNSLDRYQRIATKSAIYPGKGTPFGLMYAALGLAEAGEVQNKVKKAFRDDGVISFHGAVSARGREVEFQPITLERRTQIIKELGGVLWYIAAVCDEIGATMSEVALQNLDELCGRGERNTLRGDGDNR